MYTAIIMSQDSLKANLSFLTGSFLVLKAFAIKTISMELVRSHVFCFVLFCFVPCNKPLPGLSLSFIHLLP